MRAFLGENDMMAYLSMMAVRLLELHRVLKPTGSLYLHCDPTASHYLKLLLDGVFGPVNYVERRSFGNEQPHTDNVWLEAYGDVTDIILLLSPSRLSKYIWNQQATSLQISEREG